MIPTDFYLFIYSGLKQGFQLERDPREDTVNMCEGSYGKILYFYKN